MVGRKLGQLSHVTTCGVALGALLLAAGCSGADVSAGDEGHAINLGRCYGVDCGSSLQAAMGSEATVGEPCGPSMGTLGEPFAFEPLPQPFNKYEFELSADGSFWLLATTQPQSPYGDSEFQEPVLIHYSADGALLGISDPLRRGGAHTSLSSSLAVDAAGNAVVAIYSIYAETADSELEERLELHGFGPDFSSLGPPVRFRGIGVAHMGADASGAIVIAGNALNNAAHGTISRIVAGTPDWVQTHVPTSGQGAGIGVSGLAVTDSGAAAVLSQRSKRWEGGPHLYTYGISSFDASGMPLWDLVLPSPYEDGSRAVLASNGQGQLVVAGYGSRDSLLVRSVAPQGELGWAYTVPAFEANAFIEVETGRTFVSSSNRLAVIEADGELCRYLDLPRGEGTLEYGLGDVIVKDGFAYTMTWDGIARFELPSEPAVTP
jgi:hypothetical protein